jgi:hypothetical protein
VRRFVEWDGHRAHDVGLTVLDDRHDPVGRAGRHDDPHHHADINAYSDPDPNADSHTIGDPSKAFEAPRIVASRWSRCVSLHSEVEGRGSEPVSDLHRWNPGRASLRP